MLSTYLYELITNCLLLQIFLQVQGIPSPLFQTQGYRRLYSIYRCFLQISIFEISNSSKFMNKNVNLKYTINDQLLKQNQSYTSVMYKNLLLITYGLIIYQTLHMVSQAKILNSYMFQALLCLWDCGWKNSNYHCSQEHINQ